MKNILKKLKVPSGAKGIHPLRDWLLLLAVSGLLLITSAAWNVSFFGSVLRDEVASEGTTEAAEEKSKLPELKERFGEREAERARYETAEFVDPSR